jgi:hypothetical protein
VSGSVPANTNSTRSAHFRTLLGGSFSIVGGTIAAAIVFTIGAASQNVAIMLGGPLFVAFVMVLIAWFRADSQAEDEFFARYAAAHGLNHWRQQYSLPAFTPLLSGGDRRRCEHWMESHGRAIGWYTFECRQDNGDKPDTWEPHHFTVATMDIGEQGMARFQGIYLRRRRGILDRLDTDANWLRGHSLKRVELESTAFHERFELWAEQDQDDIILRQLFAPTFVVWLSEHPLEPGFELRAGELIVFVPDHCGEAGKLDFLMMAAADISKRIQAELSEAAQAGSL